MTILLFSMELEEEKFPTFEEKATTPKLHFVFLLYVASFFNLPFWIVILKGWRMNLNMLQMGGMSYVFAKPSSRSFQKHMTFPLVWRPKLFGHHKEGCPKIFGCNLTHPHCSIMIEKIGPQKIKDVTCFWKALNEGFSKGSHNIIRKKVFCN